MIKMKYTRKKTKIEKWKHLQDEYEKQKIENERKRELQRHVQKMGKNVSIFQNLKLSISCQGCHR